jgi:hypothetical protein
VGKHEGKRLEDLGVDWRKILKMYFKGIGFQDVDWMYMDEDSD